MSRKGTNNLLSRQIKRRLKQIENDLSQVADTINAIVEADKKLRARAEILTSIPGIASVTACAILTDMPEPGRLADAAYDANDLRRLITDDPGATPQIKQNPTRSTKQPIDWMLYKERHLVECFFNRIIRFRRIALRCEKSISSFRSFVALACAMVCRQHIRTRSATPPSAVSSG